MIEVPNPAGSANEKWQPTRWGVDAKTDRLRQLLLAEGVEEGLALGFSLAMYERMQAKSYERRELLEEFSRWANTHTHEFVDTPPELYGTHLYAPEHVAAPSPVYAYDSLNGTFTQKTTGPSVEIRYSSATNHLGKFHFLGDGWALSHVQHHQYDPSTDIWTRLADLSLTRLGSAVISSPLGVHIVAGRFAAGLDDLHELYDLDTDTYSVLAPYPLNNEWPVGGELNGKLYCFGGTLSVSGSGITNSYVYDPDTDTWSAIAPLPSARTRHAVIEYEGLFYITGGQASGSTTLWSYDPVSDSYTTLSPLGQNAHELSAGATPDGKILIMEAATSTSSYIHIYDIASDSWSSPIFSPRLQGGNMMGLTGTPA